MSKRVEGKIGFTWKQYASMLVDKRLATMGISLNVLRDICTQLPWVAQWGETGLELVEIASATIPYNLNRIKEVASNTSRAIMVRALAATRLAYQTSSASVKKLLTKSQAGLALLRGIAPACKTITKRYVTRARIGVVFVKTAWSNPTSINFALMLMPEGPVKKTVSGIMTKAIAFKASRAYWKAQIADKASSIEPALIGASQ